MKKIFAVVLSVMLLLGMLSMTAFADESTDETMIPVVVQVPEGWGAPNLWAWADDGTNAFAAWPGEEMDALAEGWYYTPIRVPMPPSRPMVSWWRPVRKCGSRSRKI